MADYTDLSREEMEKELKSAQMNLQDAEDERRFLGLQTGQHIKMAEFERIDQDIERYNKKIEQLTELLKGG